jgi:hypothetical protein
MEMDAVRGIMSPLVPQMGDIPFFAYEDNSGAISLLSG